MTAKEFYAKLTAITTWQDPGITWDLVGLAKERFGVPHEKTALRGTLHNFYFNPVTVVATAETGTFFDRSRSGFAAKSLRLERRTARRIICAIAQSPGYSPTVRRKLLKACGIPPSYA